MHDFIREIPSQDPTAAAALGVRIVSNDLTASELAAAQSFSVSLRMRNFAELESRIASPFVRHRGFESNFHRYYAAAVYRVSLLSS